MITRSRGGVAVVTVGVLALLVVAAALRTHSGFVKYALIILVGFGCILTIAKVDLFKFGVLCAFGMAFFTSWNGWRLGGLIVGDAFMLLAFGCLVFANLGAQFPRIPRWITQLAFAVVLIAVLHQLIPTNPLYLAGRLNITASGKVAPPTHGFLLSNLGIGLKFVIGIIFIPMIFSIPAMRDRRIVGRFAFAFASGAAVSGFVAFTDRLGATHLGHILTHLPAVSGTRQPGFSLHPNFLAAGCVLAVPIAIWMIVAGSRTGRFAGAALLLALVLGVYSSGSRGGAVALAATIVLTVVLMPQARAWLPQFLLGTVVLVLAVIVVLPALGAKILATTRLNGNSATTAGSDTVRSLVGEQGVKDFLHSPLDGIGLQVATQASSVYLQLAATGGLIILLSMAVYLIGGGFSAMRLVKVHSLGAPLLATLGAVLILNYFEADLTDRFYYVPEALIAALMVACYGATARPATPPAVPGRAGPAGPGPAGTTGNGRGPLRPLTHPELLSAAAVRGQPAPALVAAGNGRFGAAARPAVRATGRAGSTVGLATEQPAAPAPRRQRWLPSD